MCFRIQLHASFFVALSQQRCLSACFIHHRVGGGGGIFAETGYENFLAAADLAWRHFELNCADFSNEICYLLFGSGKPGQTSSFGGEGEKFRIHE